MNAKEKTAKIVVEKAGCSDHPISLKWADVAEVIAVHDTWTDDYDDSDSVAFMRLKDGQYAVAWESSDSTGHGCRCDGGVSYYHYKSDALKLGLTAKQRKDMGV